MLRGALLLISAAARDLAPVCTLQSRSGNYSVYNREQWSRLLPGDIEYKVGEYHSPTCFKKTELAGVHDSREAKLSIGKASEMFAVQSGHINLNNLDICYGWPETEPAFTRGPTSSEIKRANKRRISLSGKCDNPRCLVYVRSDGMNDSLANECMKNIPQYCVVEQQYEIHSSDVPPYKGTGSYVQSFSGLGTLNYDNIVPPRNGSELMVYGTSRLTINVKKDRRNDCFLLFSAYSPLTGKSLPIDYIKFEQSTKQATYILNERLTASLYNMGEFDIQFINNHRTKPCECSNIIESLHAKSWFSIIRGSKEPLSLKSRVSKDDNSTSLVISFLPIWFDLHYSLKEFPNDDFEVPVKLHLEYRNKYSAAQIDNWEVYETTNRFTKEICSVRNITREYNREVVPSSLAEWTPLRSTILLNPVSTPTEKGGALVTVEIMVHMQSGTTMPDFIQIRNVCSDPREISLPTVTLGDLRSERLQPKNDLDIIDAKEAMETVQIPVKHKIRVHFSERDFRLVPLVLPNSRGIIRDFRPWDTDCWNIDYNKDCGYCDTTRFLANESFWDCRAKCKVDCTRFLVTREATFNKSEIPRLWGAEPHQIFGYAIDLDMPPCARYYTGLDRLAVAVAYTNLAPGDVCRHNLMGNASLNVPEFTPSVYFNKIRLNRFLKNAIKKITINGQTVSEYDFDTGIVDKIGTLPRSIVIGYHYDYKSCVDKIKTIVVRYVLQYNPLKYYPYADGPFHFKPLQNIPAYDAPYNPTKRPNDRRRSQL